MMATMRSVMNKLTAIGLLAMMCSVVWLGVGAPMLDQYRNNETEIENAAKAYTRYRALAERAQELSKVADEEKTPGDATALVGESEAIVQANLQSIVQTLVAGSGSVFLSAQAAPAKSEDGIDYQGVQVVLSGELPKIAQLLQSFETYRPFLFVDRLELHRQGVSADDEIYLPVTLDVTMDVFAARRLATGAEP